MKSNPGKNMSDICFKYLLTDITLSIIQQFSSQSNFRILFQANISSKEDLLFAVTFDNTVSSEATLTYHSHAYLLPTSYSFLCDKIATSFYTVLSDNIATS